MIKKSVFEADLIAGMQKELRKQAEGETPNLVKAGECLHAALEILEEAGLQSKADRVLEVLRKIAAGDSTKVRMQMPTVEKLLEYGLTKKDLQDFGQGHAGAKAKMNIALRRMGLNEHEIAQFIGKHNVVPESELKTYETFTRWIDKPLTPEEPEAPAIEDPSIPQDLTFQSIAAKHRKPKDPAKVSDWHTKKLTPEKMVANLKHHGTEFNMADMNDSFDQELADALGANGPDELNIDDLLDADIVDDTLEVSDLVPLEDFEDEVHSVDDNDGKVVPFLDRSIAK